MNNFPLQRGQGFRCPFLSCPGIQRPRSTARSIRLPNWNGNYGEMAPPPPELYLRQARQIDLEYCSALLEFVREVGGVPYLFEDQDLWPDGMIGDGVQAKENRGLFAEKRNRSYVGPQMVAGRGWGVHVDEVAYRLRILDILGRHAVAHRSGDDLAPIWQEAIVAKPGQPHYVETEEDAWRAFIYRADRALRGFHVRVQVFADTGQGSPATFPPSSRLGFCRSSTILLTRWITSLAPTAGRSSHDK